MNTPDVVADQAVDGDIATLEPRKHTQHLSAAVSHTAPFHLRAVSHLYGVETVVVDRARVLELGCAAGGNLLPFVLANPKAQAVGIDLSPEHIDHGNRIAARLGASNMQLHAMVLDELLSSDLGQFDYIVVHGVFSLVPEDARQAIMSFCKRHLSPLGVACFHYNTYPGAKVNEVLRDAMLLHSSVATTDEARLSSARAMLNFMRQGGAARNPMSTALKQAIAQAEKRSDFSLAFEYLEGLNTPCYLVDFTSLAQQEGLAYVGDVDPRSELAAAYGDNVLELFKASQLDHNKILAQQYLDFLTGRSSRMSLLVAQERADGILNSPDLGRLRDFHWAGNFSRVFTDAGPITRGHITAQGDVLENEDAIALGMLDALGQAWPLALDFQQLVSHTQEPVALLKGETSHDGAVQAALKALFIRGAPCHFSLDGNVYEQARHTHLYVVPGLIDLLSNAIESESCRVSGFNYWHSNASLTPDAAERDVLEKLNGKHSFDQLAVFYGKALRAQEDSQLLNSESESDAAMIVRKKLCGLIDHLRRRGVLLGTSQAWMAYFQVAITAHAAEGSAALPYVYDMLFHGGVKGQRVAAGGAVKAGSGSRHPIRQSGLKAPPPSETRKVQDALDAGHLSLAQSQAQELVARYSFSAVAWQSLARVYMITGQGAKALESACRAVALDPRASQYGDIVQALWVSKRIDELYFLAIRTLRADASESTTWSMLGVFYTQRGKGYEAELCGRRALALRPRNVGMLSNLASACADNFKFDEAEQYFRQLLAIAPNATEMHSNMLFLLSHKEDIDPEMLFEEHRVFGRALELRVGGLPGKNYQCSLEPDRRLRLGFVSGDLCDHPVANFIEPIWNALDKDQFEIFIYSNTHREDTVSERLKSYTAGWQSIVSMGDKEAADRIRQDGIDILCDLSGHTAYNRLPMFAYKPAPVQFSWIGYPGTTGLQAMDYRLVSSAVKRGILDNQFTEKLVYLPSRTVFGPDLASPSINKLPALSNGYFTFASFNRTNKIGDQAIALWARVLHAVPDSKMLLGNVNGASTADEFKRRFAAHGVAEERLILRNRVPLADYLKMHGEVDLLLDTFPYGGGTTTCHAIWMGVPTLVLTGPTLAGQVGTNVMRSWGLEDFIVQTQDEYVALARRWSEQRVALADIRQGLRSRMKDIWEMSSRQSPSYYLEHAWREMWRRWCAGKAPESFEVEE